MRLLFFLVSVLSFSQLSSQTIKKFYDYKWHETDAAHARFYSTVEKTDSGWTRTDYFLHETNNVQMIGTYLDSSCKTENGMFYYFHQDKRPEYFGKYSNGKKQGLWLSYYYNGMMSDSSYYVNGQLSGISISWYPNGSIKDSTSVTDGFQTVVSWFDNGQLSSAGRYTKENKPIGKWVFYHKNGKVAARKIFENGIEKSSQYFDETGIPVETSIKDHEAEFPGGVNKWVAYLGKKLYFPDQYTLVNSDEAVVVIQFTINEEGKVENAFVRTPFYTPFNKIALKIIQSSPKWEPAVYNNRKVKFNFTQSVSFKQVVDE